MGLFPFFGAPDMSQVPLPKDPPALIRDVSKRTYNDFAEQADQLDYQIDLFKLKLPGYIQDFQTKLNANYDVYYNAKLKAYKFELVKNVDERNKQILDFQNNYGRTLKKYMDKQKKETFFDKLNPFNFLEEVKIGGNAALFDS